MLKTDWFSTDVLSFIDIDQIITKIDSICNILTIESSFMSVKKGDFLFGSVCEKIENKIKEISMLINYNYKEEEWYSLKKISYEDINRWCIAINDIETIIEELEQLNIVTEEGNKIITEDGNYIITEGV